jgi:hypothetical protein
MSILMPEKIVLATLAAGLTAIKADYSILDDIFDTDTLGAGYISKVQAYLEATPIKMAQGYGIDEAKLPGWYVIPASLSVDESVIGDFIETEENEDADIDGDDAEGKIHRYNLRVVSASLNGDVTLFLEVIARHILSSTPDWTTYGLHEVDITATDYDPIYQFLPQNLYYRSTVATFRGLSTWSRNYVIIKDVDLFIKFNPTEMFIEV